MRSTRLLPNSHVPAYRSVPLPAFHSSGCNADVFTDSNADPAAMAASGAEPAPPSDVPYRTSPPTEKPFGRHADVALPNLASD
jgi:hypothetical protein